MKLIEVIRGLETSDETVGFIHNISKQINKQTVEVNEFPGICYIKNELSDRK